MNAAQNILRNIGGSAEAMIEAGYAPLSQEKVEREPRISQPLRSYHKRYRNNIAEWVRAKREEQERQARIQAAA